MKKFEKYILILLIFAIFGKISTLGLNTYLAYASEAGLSANDVAFWTKVPLFLSGLLNIGSLIWLYLEAKAMALKAWLWATLGLFFGIWGVILFYTIQIYAKKQE